MRIFFDPDTLHQSRLGSITGVVSFQFRLERQFPSPGWSDFVVVLASWWLVELRRLAEGAHEAKLRFMDGPYWIAISSRDGGKLSLSCVEDRQGAGVVYELMVKSSDLEAEIFSFARNVSNACKLAGISSVDLDGMRAALP